MRRAVAIACTVSVLTRRSRRGAAGAAPPASPAAARADRARQWRRPPGDRLPVKRVVLYKNGVGFFEHLGRVRGTQQVSIDFTSGQLNDVLKSLTTVDLGNGKVTGVSFNTDDPANRKLGTLSLPLDEDTSALAFLGALRGARVEVQAGAGPVTGRVLAVEQRTQRRRRAPDRRPRARHRDGRRRAAHLRRDAAGCPSASSTATCAATSAATSTSSRRRGSGTCGA